MSPLLFLFFRLISPAFAGTVVIETDGAMEVQHGGVTIGRASGPGSLTLGELPAGPAVLTVVRQGKSPLKTTVNVPQEGNATLTLKGNTLSVDGTTQTLEELPPPVLVLRSTEGQRFSVIIDGKVRGILNGEWAIEDLPVGRHTIEFRTEDNLVIWAKGHVQLQPADALALIVSEGHTVETEGRSDAWTSSASPSNGGR
ncbi:MAG: hypothetical protein ACPGTU_11575 [Myxococcota bacterium]